MKDILLTWYVGSIIDNFSFSFAKFSSLRFFFCGKCLGISKNDIVCAIAAKVLEYLLFSSLSCWNEWHPHFPFRLIAQSKTWWWLQQSTKASSVIVGIWFRKSRSVQTPWSTRDTGMGYLHMANWNLFVLPIEPSTFKFIFGRGKYICIHFKDPGFFVVLLRLSLRFDV